ncbi:MAG: adenine phosphoribosyltransferase [Oscillospiraceae bacterium]|nr:adenine phosphoribosyltransferase [Oscillospiraceae bacterium]
MTYKMTVAGLDRELPLCKLNDTLSIGAFVIFGDVELTCACAKALLEKAPEYDCIVAPEAKAIPLVHEMARQSGKNEYIIARKNKKAYMSSVFEVNVKSITTEGTQTLYIDGEDAKRLQGKRVLIIDDVISTGESVRAVEQLVLAAGGIVAGRMAILAEGDACKRDDIIYLERLPLFDAEGNPIE